MAQINHLLGLLAAYLIGSFPTAIVISRILSGKDIRELGDGNAGARNVTHVLGWGAGITVGLGDFLKGALAVFLAQILHLSLEWQVLAGAFAVLGHDFPVWAHFSGGQGMATTLGALIMLMPFETSLGLLAFGATYVLSRSFDTSAAIGLGSLALLAWVRAVPEVLFLSTLMLFISIPVKKAIDWPRRRRLMREEAEAQMRERESHS